MPIELEKFSILQGQKQEILYILSNICIHGKYFNYFLYPGINNLKIAHRT